jgi:hypothetical protein
MTHLNITIDLDSDLFPDNPAEALLDMLARLMDDACEQVERAIAGDAVELLTTHGAPVGTMRVTAIDPSLVAERLVDVYASGDEPGGSIDWSDLDAVHELAVQCIGSTVA